ncbi:hypothetical protein GCM10009527_097180 [Actinomadura nitritigenes]|uniref:Uncharacterized protein n=1 Tax=Actinomadura nitritigenes TaxID=134602 RepID=A0ABS3RHF9_9ACTN|nr:hypothetical protein [Actinomadura nitritigenes]MBO2445058.1 hypothetical protein [Actinomadura nitritigenes]
MTASSADLPPLPSEVRMPSHARPGHTIVALHGGLDADAAPAPRENPPGVLRHHGLLLILGTGEVSSCEEAGLVALASPRAQAEAAA